MALATITGGGAFTRQNIQDINNNFAAVTQPDIWVRPQAGTTDSAGDGSYAKPYVSMAGAVGSRLFGPGVVIGLEGVLLEEITMPIVNDVSIVGMANQPRQATTSGAPNGGGATWLSPSGGTGSLLTWRGQAGLIQNIYFNNTATGATTGCVKLVGGGDPPLTPDAGHTRIYGCRFTGEANGIYISAGPGFLDIKDNIFLNFDSASDCAILAGDAGGTGWQSRIRNNVFTANTIHIKGLSWAYGWEVCDNRFSYIDVGVTTTTQIDFTGGSNNSVHDNTFDLPYNTSGITAMFALGTNDRWKFNKFSTAVTTTIFSFGAPSS